MFKSLSIFFIFFSISNFALSGPPIDFLDGKKNVTFVDMTNITYNLIVDGDEQSVKAYSIIDFNSRSTGHPAFDVVPDVVQAKINGQMVDTKLVKAPDSEGQYLRYVDKNLVAGSHRLELWHELSFNHSVFSNGGAAFGFFMSDLASRKLLERYLPTNFQYDQMKMKMNIEFKGLRAEQIIVTNGKNTKIGKAKYSIEYPSFYNSSSLYFHTFPKDYYRSTTDKFVDPSTGKKIHILVYGGRFVNLGSFVDQSKKTLLEFSKKYGEFPFPHLLVYATGFGGGMEYAGATATSYNALAHEIAHSYWGRGFMPADGNAGWIDEAMATWTAGPGRIGPLRSSGSNMGGKSQYTRGTDSLGYGHGSGLLQHIHTKISTKSGTDFYDFLNLWSKKSRYKTVTNEYFRGALQSFFQSDLKDLFDFHVYGKTNIETHYEEVANDVHMSLEMADTLHWPEM